MGSAGSFGASDRVAVLTDRQPKSNYFSWAETIHQMQIHPLPRARLPCACVTGVVLVGLRTCLPQRSEQLLGVVASSSTGRLFLHRPSWTSSTFPRGLPRTHLFRGFGSVEKALPLDSMEHTESSPMAEDEPKSDVLTKIGHANILGWTLQELGQLLHNVPIGTTLQIRVYRDFIEIPQHWQSAVELIPEVKLPVMTADTSEDAEDEDDTGSSSDDDDVDLETFQYTSSQSYCSEFTCKLPPPSKIWQISDTSQTLRVGTGNVCDVVLHDDVEALCNPEFDTGGVRPPSYGAKENNETSSSSSCSSVSDTAYLEEFAFVSE
ncbi:PDZ domain-containing protein 9 isoform X2 [Falco rusticolus]|uniref:PDZ domain-containing protein 9 isoform X2 n=1 Tax=Falco rusticolus TaxID=120794 RepID=UPI0018865699|nr:PDZ domain-containing protein 9 isoform X2 [Falco rusticolus]XP_055563341.1 PDZ domain-containing protein 9 isoform X2 [Falco cherrug]